MQIHGTPPARAADYADTDFFVILNAWNQALQFELAPLAGLKWHRLIDTSLPAPREILDEGAARLRDRALADEPLVQARLQETIGRLG